uniref:RNase Phy4 n=1 Tax=Petunia hybrida TaxID=4102 RepID=C9E780_PETHY|nr:RNase Phy4 [Petunia x hybrida]
MEFLIMIMMFNMLVPQIFSQVNDYHIMQFVLGWNPSFCSKPDTKSCVNPVPENFTIHGLWPANAYANSLYLKMPTSWKEKQDLKNDMALLNQDQNLVNSLHHVWPSVVPKFPAELFWRHEWAKHGFGIRAQIDVKTYFEAATRIHDTMIAINGKTNLKGYFTGVGIQPGKSVTVRQLGRALNPLVNGIDIRCYNNGTHNFLLEVIFCLDKSSLYSFISCQRAYRRTGLVQLTRSCDPNDPLYLPS